MSFRASGTFEVTLTPQPPYATCGGVDLSRMGVVKQFSGDLEASSTVEMLSAVTPVQGSAGYVAIEPVEGRLKERTGTFVLQHSGTMDRGAGQLRVTVVPDSGTGELRGISGSMTIEIVDGRHLYTFDYAFSAAEQI